MEKFNKKLITLLRKNFVYFTILLIISLLPFILAQHGGNLLLTVFNGFEYQTFDEFLQVWHKSYLGMYSVLFTPQLLLAFLLFKIFSPALANMLLFGSIKFLAGISIFILLGNFTKDKTTRVVGSVFYLLSIYGQAIIENTPSGGYIFYAVLPLIFHLFITITKNNAPKKLLLLALSMLLISDTNFTYIVYMFLLLFLYAIYSFIVEKDKSRLLYFFVFGLIFIGAIFYYYLPLFAYNFIFRSDIVSSNLQAESAGWKGSYSSPSEIFRLMGSLDFYNMYTFGYLDFYARPFFLYFIHRPYILFLSFIPPLLAFLGLCMGSVKQSKIKIKSPFFLWVFLLFFFFSVGAHNSNPFQEIYEFLSKQFLLFAIFRDPYKSVSILNLVYTLGIVYLFNRLIADRKSYKITLFIFASVILILSLSYLRGDVYRKSELISVPDHVYDLAEWNKSSKEIISSKKLLLPYQPFPILTFANYPGKSGPIYYQILNSTAVHGNAQFTPYIDQIQKLALDENFEKIAGFYNIPYIVLSKDLEHKMYQSMDPEIISTYGNRTFKKIEQFGGNNIEVFNVNDSFFNNVIYVPQRIIQATTSADFQNNIDLKYIFSDQDDNNFAFGTKEQLKGIPTKTIFDRPKIDVKRKSNVEFEVTVHNMTNDFLLVFNESYNRGWVMKDNNSFFTQLPFKHVLINGIGNGYWIEKDIVSKYMSKNSSTPTTFTLTLYFQPQIYFYLGLLGTGLTLLTLIIYFLRSKLTYNKN